MMYSLQKCPCSCFNKKFKFIKKQPAHQMKRAGDLILGGAYSALAASASISSFNALTGALRTPSTTSSMFTSSASAAASGAASLAASSAAAAAPANSAACLSVDA